jgi:hypothetical protein
MVLEKLDANKDAAKRKALFEAAMAALSKWETEIQAKPAAEKAKLMVLLPDLAKMKKSLMDAMGAPPPPPEPPYKKTNVSPEYSKARSDVPFGAVAVALWNLDRADNRTDAKTLAAAAHTAIEKELADVDAAVKGATDNDLKLKVSQYGVALRKVLATVAALKK